MFDTRGLANFSRDGFFIIRNFAAPEVGTGMLDAVVDIARRSAANEDIWPAFITPENNLAKGTVRETATPEDLISKIFRLHGNEPFRGFTQRADLLDAVCRIVDSEDVDCFLSQFIFKNPGAWGQPCHQDSYYFPFEPARPVIGAWLAVTPATLENGCLHVVPGSQRESVHEHVPDRRPAANYGYYEIIDYDLSDSVPVLMEPGDLLLFDSHLMHFSTDNLSTRLRAAMVFHFARAGTIDRSEARSGYTVNQWVPVHRAS